MKKIVMCLTSLFLLFMLTIPIAFASSYEYIFDNSNLFDDSTDMISMAKEIRNKLDFDIHVYSVASLEDIEEIINEHVQNSSVLLIFVSKENEMSWYSGSSVQQTIRDIDFENLFSHVSISRKQYTQAVNFILSKILSIYVYENETIDDYAISSDYMDIQNQSWLSLNFHYCVNFIRQHPVRILVILIFLIGCVIYLTQHNKNSSDTYEDFDEEDMS